MTKPIIALAVAALLFQDPKPVRNPWAGLPAGSWVIIESERTVGQKKKTERRQVTVEIEPNGDVTHSVGTYTEDGKPPIMFEPRTHPPGVGVSDACGDASKPVPEDLQIGGKKIACERTEYARKDETQGLAISAKVWRAKGIKIPYRELVLALGDDLALDPDIVRIEVSLKKGGDTETASLKLVELDHKLAVGGTDVACFLEEGAVDFKIGTRVMKGTLRQWLNDKVPGRVVRVEVRGETGDVKLELDERVTNFKVPR